MYDENDDETLYQIFEAIDYNTQVIEVLAKNMLNFNNQLKQHYKVNDLLRDLQNNGLLQLSKSDAVATKKYAKATPAAIFKAMFNINELNEQEKQLLQLIAFLPSVNIPFEHLEDILPNIENLDHNLLNLSKKGWLKYFENEKAFKCNHVIQEVCLDVKEQENELLNTFVSSIYDKLYFLSVVTHKKTENLPLKNYINYAESLINNDIKYGVSIWPNLCHLVYDYHLNYNSLTLAEKYSKIYNQQYQQLYDQDPSNVNFKNGLAISYSKLGEINEAKGNLDEALKNCLESNRLGKELYAQDPSNVNFKNGLAISYEKLGIINKAKGNLDEALKNYLESNKLIKELYDQDPSNVNFKNGLAISYSKLGNINKAKGNLDDALKNYLESNKLIKELYDQDPSNVNFKNGLAVSYERLGNINKAKGNLDDALKNYLESNRLGKELYAQDPSNVNFKNGLAISYEKLGTINEAKGNLDEALKNYLEDLKLIKELYAQDPSNVNFKNGLAVSYTKLATIAIQQNDTAKAINYYKQAEQHWLTLNTQFPAYVEFSKNLANVKRDLKALE